MEWLINTEWKGKTSKYLLLRDGIIESTLKECEPEGQCLWAANGGKVAINTPTLKIVKFKLEGYDKADKKKLMDKDDAELNKIELVAEKAGKSGKKSRLGFSRVAVADDAGETFVAKDLFKLLDVSEEADSKEVKSKFRRLSVQNHPDKGGDIKVFNEMREAFEVLGDNDQRKYYMEGGMQLVKNVENSWKEVEGQKSQLDAKLNQVPKNHPQRRQFEMQIEQQKKQFEKGNMKREIEKKMRNDDLEVDVPISAEELYNGVPSKSFEFKRLVICRGCRADPDTPECKECGRCPPEKVQVPKYGNTPFGKQVVGMKEKEQESRERCREVPVVIDGLRVPKGAKEGSVLRHVSDAGHQTPGKLPGRLVLKVQRGSPKDYYRIAEADLHTVLRISVEQALFGFDVSWSHLGAEKVTIARDRLERPDEVLRLTKLGLAQGGSRGDLYVRIAVDYPQVEKGAKELTLRPVAAGGEARLEREDELEIQEGAAWRRWRARETPTVIKAKEAVQGAKKSQEL
jgi:DnaJ-class molecular chaperone